MTLPASTLYSLGVRPGPILVEDDDYFPEAWIMDGEALETAAGVFGLTMKQEPSVVGIMARVILCGIAVIGGCAMAWGALAVTVWGLERVQ